MRNIKEHIVEYLILFVAIFVFLLLFFIFRFDKNSLGIISALASVFYILWGIIHHVLRDRLTKSIFFEYVLFGSLVFLLLYTVLSF
ncbi:MAG: hypothetical protein ABIJ82_00450 [Patescibacteria group bacterium]|nr:hypothetical protein [Patescibacteria group bacterium]MBU1953053.1 hypothetical protein [Patescibacteria group bacterium]